MEEIRKKQSNKSIVKECTRVTIETSCSTPGSCSHIYIYISCEQEE